MPAASILVKPASGSCNMDCGYCFYKRLCEGRKSGAAKIMSGETLESLIASAADYADEYLAFAFQGGEPTLAGIDFYRRAVELQERYNKKNLTIENTFQTNGYAIDEEWAEFFAENDFLVGLSLDGPRKLHDKYRRDARGEGTFSRVMRAIELFKKYKVKFNILAVVTNEAAESASAIYRFFCRNGFDYVQLIPCMDERERGMGRGEKSLMVDPERYGKFLCEFFDLWIGDFYGGGPAMDVRMFSNLAQMAAGFPAEECGMEGRCSCYFAVEADGSVYPCDFYCMDEWRLGSVGEPFLELAESERARRFIAQSDARSPKCAECPYVSLCRGGCRRWREEAGGAVGCNALCRAYEIFFGHAWDDIKGLGRLIRQRYGMAPIE